MLSPSKPPHATGEAVQCAPASSLEAIVEQAAAPLAIQFTLKALPVRWSTTRNGSRLVKGAAAGGETSTQRVKSALERRTTGVSGAPLTDPGRSSQPWKSTRPSRVKPMLGSIERAPVGYRHGIRRG